MRNPFDPAARAGTLLGAFYTGLSYQPNLLTRATRDQAVIGGVAAAVGYAWGVTGHSLLRTTVDRLLRTAPPAAGRTAGVIVDVLAAGGGIAAVRALPVAEHESPRRSLLRLGALGLGAVGVAGLGSDVLGALPKRGQTAGTLAAALAAAAIGYQLTRGDRPGSVMLAGEDDADPGLRSPQPEVVTFTAPSAVASGTTREVVLHKAALSSLAVTGVLVGVARAESAATGFASKVITGIVGGEPESHRTAGRLTAAALTAAAGWGAITLVDARLTPAGEAMEPAHATAPDLPEVTGGPGSLSRWADQTRESRRWLSMVLQPAEITAVMGEPAGQPIRVYASLNAAATPLARAELLLAEIDRTDALRRRVFALFSPTGSGYVNYVGTETLEFLTRGNCASAAIQYSVLPSALSLTRVAEGIDQTRIVVNGLLARLRAMPASKRPQFVLFGESLGSQVSQEMFRGQGISGPLGIGLDAAIWLGTPEATQWRDELWGTRSVADPPQVGPGAAFLPRAVRDWHDLDPADRQRVRYLLLQNGDDPIPKFGARLLWRQPDWLGPQQTRPPGSPRGTSWLPAVTFISTFLDMQNALSPTPGIFQEGGHDYRREIPEAVRTVFRLKASDAQMARVEAALRARELRWQVTRDWLAAQALPAVRRDQAERAVLDRVARWTGAPADADTIAHIIAGEDSP